VTKINPLKIVASRCGVWLLTFPLGKGQPRSSSNQISHLQGFTTSYRDTRSRNLFCHTAISRILWVTKTKVQFLGWAVCILLFPEGQKQMRERKGYPFKIPLPRLVNSLGEWLHLGIFLATLEITFSVRFTSPGPRFKSKIREPFRSPFYCFPVFP